MLWSLIFGNIVNFLAPPLYKIFKSRLIYPYRHPFISLIDAYNKSGLHIYLSCVPQNNDSLYYKVMTGCGEVYCIAYLLPILARLFNGNRKLRTYISKEKKPNFTHVENLDLILIGGPKHNPHTAHLLTHFRQLTYKFKQARNRDYYIYDQIYEKEYGPLISDRLEKDYGVLIKLPNPYSVKNNVTLILAGIHTFGTAGVMKALSKWRDTLMFTKNPITKNCFEQLFEVTVSENNLVAEVAFIGEPRKIEVNQ